MNEPRGNIEEWRLYYDHARFHSSRRDLTLDEIAQEGKRQAIDEDANALV